MKMKLRPRYYCDYCRKCSGRKDVISRHETGCTANPNRVCGCCRLAAMKQHSLEELLAALRDDMKNYGTYSPHDDGESCHLSAAPSLITLIKPFDNDSLFCPACMLAALRAANASLSDFVFKDRMAAWMNEFGRVRDGGFI